jgi:hypothetical protein
VKGRRHSRHHEEEISGRERVNWRKTLIALLVAAIMPVTAGRAAELSG